jgi:peroxiredoxin
MAAVVLVAGTGPALDAWVRARSAAELVAVAVGAAAVVVAMFALQLWTEVRKLRVDIRAAERMAAGAPPGLPVGVLAPRFELESMDGGRVSLEGLLERGPSALLVFASPGCGSCVELFPNVRRWQQTLSERLTIAILSTGDLENNRTLRDRYGLEQLLVQEKSEMFEAYRIRGTPSAVLVKPDGKIASLPAESVFAIEPMVRLVLRDQASPAVENDHATVEGSIA